eukprot:CAMPEP_0201879740 /NCGR_PEP_ID=MMETSP0902-20130614/10559_1 /ASSEMBLY_ACC=CAM_ASM_000551 /TAXON_ID=420261 /ORGANISM="Thalassiosira antarctica, Strain CCMP982" /LENGTH=382 /DNA_ID=CAMNT_0048407657 /DNA_START=111 /DNA_END=1259 /DNA_ORIENTATION=+
MISIVRFLLLTQLCRIPQVTSSKGPLRGSDSRELIEINNSTDIHHQASHMTGGRIEQRIIGGNKAKLGRYSYTVGLIDGQGLYCGGALISKDMVLTAAHCGEGSDLNFDVFAGSEYLSDRFDNRYGEMLSPKKKWSHPDFSYGTMNNDFLIYQLNKPVTVDVEVVRVNDDSRNPSRQGDRLVALGWGNTNANGAYKGSDALMEVGVGYIPNPDCRKRTGYVGNDYVNYQSQVQESMLCSLDNGKDGCQGDSGGPLIIEGNDSKGRNDVLVGLSSWGVACAHSTLPGVYARVSYQYKWIKSIVCNNSGDQTARQVFNCDGASTGNGKPDGYVVKPSNNKPKPSPGKKKNKKKNKKKKNKRKKKNKKKNKKNIQRVRRRHELFM